MFSDMFVLLYILSRTCLAGPIQVLFGGREGGGGEKEVKSPSYYY